MPAFSRTKSLLKDFLPPIVLRAIRRRPVALPSSDPAAAGAMDAFYGSLLSRDSLCFDIGANVGNRVAAFRRLGLRVIAVEPQPRCYARLKASFGADPGVTLVNKGAGSIRGQATMMVASVDTVSTLSQAFIDATTRTKRFDGISWNETIAVELVTLDELIAAHGSPDFIKIDVEGYELEVIRGLSRAVPLISLEWVPELTDSLLACVAHLSRLGPVEFNLSWMESMRMSRCHWMNEEALRNVLHEFREDTYLFGDVYVRSKAGG